MYYDNIFIDSELPKTLNEEEFLECVKQVRMGNLEARDKIILHNMRLVLYQVLNKFAHVPYEKEELVSAGMFGLMKAVDTFDITREVKFPTYASRCIDHEIIMFMRKEKRYLNQASLEEPIVNDKNDGEVNLVGTIEDKNSYFVEDIIENELLLAVKKQVDMLEDKDREIVKLYFGFDDNKCYSQREIGTMMNVSQSYISRIIKRVVNAIGNNLEEQELIQRARKRKSQTNFRSSIIEADVNQENVVDEEIELFSKSLSDSLLSNGDNTPKEEYAKILELLRTPTFTQMVKVVSPREAIILSLELGYVDGKEFSTASIAKLLGIEEDEVRETVKRILPLYKASVNGLACEDINVITDQSVLSKVKK